MVVVEDLNFDSEIELELNQKFVYFWILKLYSIWN